MTRNRRYPVLRVHGKRLETLGLGADAFASEVIRQKPCEAEVDVWVDNWLGQDRKHPLEYADRTWLVQLARLAMAIHHGKPDAKIEETTALAVIALRRLCKAFVSSHPKPVELAWGALDAQLTSDAKGVVQKALNDLARELTAGVPESVEPVKRVVRIPGSHPGGFVEREQRSKERAFRQESYQSQHPLPGSFEGGKRR